MTKASDNVYPRLLISEGGSTSTPASGNVTVYAKADGLLYSKDDAGAETALGGGTAGALVLLEQHTASASASLDFTTFISSTYDEYLIEGVALRPATDAQNLQVQAGTGGGPTWDTGNNYNWGSSCINGTAGTHIIDNGATGIGRIGASIANNAAYGNISFSLRLTVPQSTSQRRKMHGTAQYANTVTPAEFYCHIGWTYTNATTAMTGLRFIMSSGNITSGTIRIYGLAK